MGRALALALLLGCTRADVTAPPGKVVMVDDRGERLIDHNELPESERFVEVDGGKVPVARIVLRRIGDRGEILKYGPKGELLEVTVGRFGP